MLCNDALEYSFKELKHIVSVKTLLSYPDWKIPFTVHISDSDKQLDAVMKHNNKPISLFSRRLSKPQCKYITNKK